MSPNATPTPTPSAGPPRPTIDPNATPPPTPTKEPHHRITGRVDVGVGTEISIWIDTTGDWTDESRQMRKLETSVCR